MLQNQQLKKLIPLLDGSNKIKQSYLPGGYDQYSLHDVQWQSLHMAAAAACRGSTPSGGSGGNYNEVYPRQHGQSCKNVCGKTSRKTCDSEITINGFMGKATSNTKKVGVYFNYGCGYGPTWGDEVKMQDIRIIDPYLGGVSYCCCR